MKTENIIFKTLRVVFFEYFQPILLPRNSRKSKDLWKQKYCIQIN